MGDWGEKEMEKGKKESLTQHVIFHAAPSPESLWGFKYKPINISQSVVKLSTP